MRCLDFPNFLIFFRFSLFGQTATAFNALIVRSGGTRAKQHASMIDQLIDSASTRSVRLDELMDRLGMEEIPNSGRADDGNCFSHDTQHRSLACWRFISDFVSFVTRLNEEGSTASASTNAPTIVPTGKLVKSISSKIRTACPANGLIYRQSHYDNTISCRAGLTPSEPGANTFSAALNKSLAARLLGVMKGGERR